MRKILVLGVFAAATSLAGGSATTRDGIFSEAQASAGQHLYMQHCSLCHRESLAGGVNESPPLKGPRFMQNWAGHDLKALYGRIISTMPVSDPGSLSDQETIDIVSFLLRENGFPPGNTLEKDRLPAITLAAP